jgi:uncharacterized protein (DUF2249 family)
MYIGYNIKNQIRRSVMSITKLDSREFKSMDDSKVVFETFDSLELGEIIELTYDHDPNPLYDQLNAERPGQFEWNYLQRGPEIWKIAIQKKYLSFI